MRTKKQSQPLTERDIDTIVVAQADDDTVWGKPVRVRGRKSARVPLPSALATRVAFFARLHREKSMEAWIERVIQERLDLEEAAFAGLKRDLATRSSSAPQEL
jgi:limonene-1,2-epoxide hydrolase